MDTANFPYEPRSSTSSNCVVEDLLFFDTFSHSSSEKENFDLVQFPSPVVIDLIKIVPLGQPIEAKIPGNVRLGATNPSNCELEFFINDLTKQDAHTMTDLGRFYCSEKDTDFTPPLHIQTDGLLLRGSYRTLTLAIFGQIASYYDKVEEEQIIMSAASPPAQTPASPVPSEHEVPYVARPVYQEILPTDSNDELAGVVSVEDAIIDLNDPSNNNHNNIIHEELSRGDGGSSVNYSRKKNEDIDYSDSADAENGIHKTRGEDFVRDASEQISLNDHSENRKAFGDESDDDDDEEEPVEWTFSPESYRPEPLLYFPDPSYTLQERSLILHKSKSVDPTYRAAMQKGIEKVREMFEALDSPDGTKSDDWVTLTEDLANDLANMSLSQTAGDPETLKFLVKQVVDGLDFDLAMRQKQTGFKVRHIRAGLKLATILFHCGEIAVSTLIEASVLHKVLLLYNQNQMSLPLRLLMLKCLSAACDNVQGVDHLVTHKYQWDASCFCLKDIRTKVLNEREQSQESQFSAPTLAKFEPLAIKKEDESENCSSPQGTKEPISPRRLSQDQSSIVELHQTEGSQESMTCYQYLLLMLLSKPSTRVTIAIGSLIKKIRLYLNLSKLLPDNPGTSEDPEDSVFEPDESSTLKEISNLEQRVQIIQDIVHLTRDNCVNIAQPIRHLPAKIQFQVRPNATDTYLAVYRWMKHFKTLDQLNTLLMFLQSSANNIMLPADVELSIRFQNLCLAFIQQLIDSPRGGQYFLSDDCCESTTKLLHTLANIHPLKRSSHVRLSDGIENCLSASICKEESLAASSCRDSSLRMSYNFKVISCIDKLFHFHRELLSKRSDFLYDPERMLHQLYIISQNPYGLNAIVRHLSSIGNLDCLLRFLDVPDNHKHLEFVKETSIDYALDLVGTFFRLNNNVLEIAEEYLDTLMDLCKTKEKNLSVRIKSLIPWLNPFEPDQPLPLITYTEDTFRRLVRVIRKSIPDCSIPFAKALDFELPPQMITAVRILRQLCIPPQVENFIADTFDPYSTHKFVINQQLKSTSFMNFVESLPNNQSHNQLWNLNLQLSRQNGAHDDSYTDSINQISNTFKLFQPYDESICGELKYHYGIMQVYEQEGLKRLLNTLRELTGNYPRPIYQSAALSGLRGRIVISYLNSVVVLLHSIICHLIDARGSDFKDTSVIPVILETYSLLCFVPEPTTEPLKTVDINSLHSSITIRSDNYNLAQQTKKLILSILMSYTQMCLSVSESEEKVISKSMWTKMLKEVIEFTLSTPVFFHHGLDVLTQIIPSPLPGSSMMDSIDQEQLFKNINHRKLWSAHLHPLHQQIEHMISSLGLSYQSNIRSLLYYFCNQLCDLSTTAACMVAKTLTDSLLSKAAKVSSEATQQQSDQQSTTPQQGTSARSLEGIDNFRHVKANEKAYAVKMILNLLSNLITNQAFETAFTNHLQVLGKKDEKLLTSLQSTLKLNEEMNPGDAVDDSLNTSGNNSSSSANLASVVQLIEGIKSMNDTLNKDGFINPANDVAPPEELTKINLLEVSHKISDRFPLANSLSRTYRLKVLLDINSRAHRSNEIPAASSSSSSNKRFDHQGPPYSSYPTSSSSSVRKPYVPPLPPRIRPRPNSRADMFRSRPQNTSRPPSIHVDDFIDLYGKSPGHSSSSRGYPGSHKNDYRSPLPPPQPPPVHYGSPYGGDRSGGRSHHSRSKHMKSK